MKTPLLAGAGFAAAMMLSVEIGPAAPAAAPSDAAIAALDPLMLARSLCGGDGADNFQRSRAFFLRAASAYAQAAGMGPGGYTPAAPDLGPSSLDITTASPEAQARFNDGLRWAAGFNHVPAIAAFRAAQAADPDCAMCYWGEAWALGPNINSAMAADAYAPAWAAVQKAKSLAGGTTDLEQALIAALEARYTPEAPASRADLDLSFAMAMNAVADRYPDNDEVQAMAVEAGMDTQAWDYWQADHRTPKGFTIDNLARLETVLARNPDHAPSIHLYIHMTEASDDPWRAEPYADRLAGLAPAAGHLVHMPAHVYFRIGRFADSMDTNLDAIVADEAYLEEAGDAASPLYRYGYYPHNVHFVLTSAQRAGDAATVEAFGPKLDDAIPMEMAHAAAYTIPIKAAPIFALAQYEDPETLLARPMPADLPPYLEAAWDYAFGVASARAGNGAGARAAAERIAAAEAAGAFEGDPTTVQLVQLMQAVLMGRAAQADGDAAAAVEHFENAALIQDAIPYMEPPYWYYPVRQSFAAALLQDGQTARAEQEFYRTLVEYPDNGWAYWGLAQARAARGDDAGAELAMSQFHRAWLGEDDAISLDRL